MNLPNSLEEQNTIRLPHDVTMVIERLEEAGYEAWAVGGCVRDNLLSRKPKDYDVASLCPPELIGTLFPHCISTGLAYGTITVLTESVPVEVTVFRKEADYTDSRHPGTVTPADSITADLSRRDFTINAVAWHPLRGFCDPFQGRLDMIEKRVRAVGDPAVRFDEDALRILRCLRFASELDFVIEPHTKTAALSLAFTLKNISIERITAELSRLLCGQKPELAVPFIEAGGLRHIGLQPHDLKETDAVPLILVPSLFPLRLAGLLSLYPNCVHSDVLKSLRLDNKTHRTTQALLYQIHSPLPASLAELKRAFSILPPEYWEGMLKLRAVLLGENTHSVYQWLKTAAEEPWNRSMLALSGIDLQGLGFTGKKIGSILSTLLEIVIEEPSLNTRTLLIKEAQKIK